MDSGGNMNNKTCPFCNEEGFDLIGLKLHLNRSCDAYDDIDIFSIKPFKFIKEYKYGKT